jgi:hypothetical protein
MVNNFTNYFWTNHSSVKKKIIKYMYTIQREKPNVHSDRRLQNELNLFYDVLLNHKIIQAQRRKVCHLQKSLIETCT